MRCRFCLYVLLFATALLSFPAVSAEEAPCTAHDGDKYYDLSSLKSSKDYEFISPNGHDFVINVCKPVNNETWALKVPDPGNVAGFVRRDRGDFSIGNMNTTLKIRDGHPVLIMTDGSRCPRADSMTASTAIRFICDTSVFGTGHPEFVAQLPPDDESACAFFVEWRTHIACPTHEKTGSLGFLTVLAAILATALMLYIIVGTFYKRYVLELRGFDQFPRISLVSFSDTIGFLRAWIDRFKHRHLGAWGTSGGDAWRRGNSNGYGGLGDEEEPMMHGPPGFLDEQDEEDPHEQDTHANEAPKSAGIDSDGVIRL